MAGDNEHPAGPDLPIETYHIRYDMTHALARSTRRRVSTQFDVICSSACERDHEIVAILLYHHCVFKCLYHHLIVCASTCARLRRAPSAVSKHKPIKDSGKKWHSKVRVELLSTCWKLSNQLPKHNCSETRCQHPVACSDFAHIALNYTHHAIFRFQCSALKEHFLAYV